jgi:hypothetical protein
MQTPGRAIWEAWWGQGNCAVGTSCYAQLEARYDLTVQASQQKLLSEYLADLAANNGAPQKPCAGADASNLDYKTPRYYASEGI